MFVQIGTHLVNIFNVNHIEKDGEDVGIWFKDGSHIIAFDVKWKKLKRRLERQPFSSLLPSTSVK